MIILPLRLFKTLISACFAVHSRFVTGLLAFVALFGFWELFNGVAKEPLVQLYQTKQIELQFEDGARNGNNSLGDKLYTNYRAAKFVLGAEWRALQAAVSTDDTSPKEIRPTPTDGSWIENALRRMSRSIDREETRSFNKQGENIGGSIATRDRQAAARQAAHAPPPFKLSPFLIVDGSLGIRFFPITDRETLDQIKTGYNLSDHWLPLTEFETLTEGAELRAVQNTESGLAVKTNIDQLGESDVVTVPKTGVFGAVPQKEYSRLKPLTERGSVNQPTDIATGIDRDHFVVVSGERLRYAAVSMVQANNRQGLNQFHFEIEGTLPPSTVLIQHTGHAVGRGTVPHVTANIDGVGASYLFVINETGHEILVPVSDVRSKTKQVNATAINGVEP